MKNIALIFILSFSIQSCFSQNLSLKQLIEIKEGDISAAKQYLIENNWEFLNEEQPLLREMGYATFAYNRDQLTNTAESFLNFYHSKYLSTIRVNIQGNLKLKYSEYEKAIEDFGCILISTGKEVKVYRGEIYTFKVSCSRNSIDENQEFVPWGVFIISNEDYDLNWANK